MAYQLQMVTNKLPNYLFSFILLPQLELKLVSFICQLLLTTKSIVFLLLLMHSVTNFNNQEMKMLIPYFYSTNLLPMAMEQAQLATMEEASYSPMGKLSGEPYLVQEHFLYQHFQEQYIHTAMLSLPLHFVLISHEYQVSFYGLYKDSDQPC